MKFTNKYLIIISLLFLTTIIFSYVNIIANENSKRQILIKNIKKQNKNKNDAIDNKLIEKLKDSDYYKKAMIEQKAEASLNQIKIERMNREIKKLTVSTKLIIAKKNYDTTKIMNKKKEIPSNPDDIAWIKELEKRLGNLQKKFDKITKLNSTNKNKQKLLIEEQKQQMENIKRIEKERITAIKTKNILERTREFKIKLISIAITKENTTGLVKILDYKNIVKKLMIKKGDSIFNDLVFIEKFNKKNLVLTSYKNKKNIKLIIPIHSLAQKNGITIIVLLKDKNTFKIEKLYQK